MYSSLSIRCCGFPTYSLGPILSQMAASGARLRRQRLTLALRRYDCKDFPPKRYGYPLRRGLRPISQDASHVPIRRYRPLSHTRAEISPTVEVGLKARTIADSENVAQIHRFVAENQQ